MKHLGVIPLSVVAFIVGCDTDSNTSTDPLASSPKGELRYERHYDLDQTSFKCNVYATNHSITLDMSLNVLNEQSWIHQRINTDFSTAAYTGSIEAAGLFNNAIGAQCEKFKSDCASMENANVSCSNNKVVFSAVIPNVEPAYSEIYTARTLDKFNSICDNLYEEYQDSPFIASNGDETKKALSCDVQVNGSSFVQVVTYSDKSLVLTTSQANGVYSVVESYTGIDATTLAKVCQTYKQEGALTDVTCVGSDISYNTRFDPDFNSLVEYARDMLCPAYLNGSYTLEQMWFED